jgi:hypothetical protein
MIKYRIGLETIAMAYVTVEIPDDTPEYEREELAEEEAHKQGVPGICAQCSGWGQPHSLALGDEWEVSKDSMGRLDIEAI